MKNFYKFGVIILGFMVVFAILPMGCATVGSYIGMEEPLGDTPAIDDYYEAGTREQYTQSLRDEVRRYMSAEEANNNKDRVIRRRPYYLKEYAEYPSGLDGILMELHETETLTSPFTAEVTMPKVRYATQLHRDRGDARSDNSFIRDTGTETLNYVLRGNRWTRVGGLFVPERSEEFVDGRWEAVVREFERRADPDYTPGFFERTWMRVRGE